MIPQIIVMSSHLDKCIVSLGHFSTTNISPEGKGTGGQRRGGQLPPPSTAHGSVPTRKGLTINALVLESFINVYN